MNIKDINGQLEELDSLSILVESYQEIAASRMRRTRVSVLQTRDFLLGLLRVFGKVKSSYKNQVAKLLKKGEIKSLEKTAHVLVSANTGLYGDIVGQTFKLFMEHVRNSQGEAVIIGRRGYLLFQQEKVRPAHVYFDFPDHTVDLKLFIPIAQHLAQFDNVFVYYGRFENLIKQTATVSSVSGDVLLAKQEVGVSVKYIFEPSVEKLLGFFKKELATNLFEQVLFESQLAKFASRMVSLDLSLEQVRENMQKTKFERERVRHRIQNNKQISMLSGMKLWKR